MAVGRRTFAAAFKAECVEMYRNGHSFAEISKQQEHAGRHPAARTVKDWVFAANARVKRSRAKAEAGDTERMVREMAAVVGANLAARLEVEPDTEKLIKAFDVLTKRVIEFEKRTRPDEPEAEADNTGVAPVGPGIAR